MTQCVNYQVLKRNISKLEMCKKIKMRFEYNEIGVLSDVDNIAQKINGKLGGINGVVNIRSSLSRSTREDLFMFFGADVNLSKEFCDRKSDFSIGHSFNILI